MKEGEKALDAVLEILHAELAAGRDIALYGFGTFKVTERSERKGRNPRTGEEMTIPASKAVKFVPSAALKDAIK